jgi:hypothetical protein
MIAAAVSPAPSSERDFATVATPKRVCLSSAAIDARIKIENGLE